MKKRIPFLLLIAAVMLVALAAGPVFGGSDDGLQRADQARQRHTDALLANPGVVGVALGRNPAGRASVLVFTTKAGVSGIPRNVDGVPVHVRVTGEIFAFNPPPHDHGGGGGDGETVDATDPTARFTRPVPIGVSTGHPDITAGTIGARVKDGAGNVYALSNNHVYADENQASIGDAVIQPGTFDDGSSPDDDIGTLSDFETIVFSTSASNVIDAAIALSSTADLGNATPSDGYGTPKSTTMTAVLDMKVKKYGRTTGETKATVPGINATVIVGYSTGTARFVNQIIITPGTFSAGGDSGSLIVVDGKGRNKADNGKPVGLLFAGSFFMTVANPIDAVLDRFGVTIDGN